VRPALVRTGAHYLRAGDTPVLPVGAHFVPVQGPDWPWRVDESSFDRAFSQMAAAGMNTVRIDLLWSAIEPELGKYDEEHLRRLDAVLESARRHALWLHPTLFIGGEVGDAFWDIPWRENRQPHRDPEMLRLQREHASMLARRWRGDPTVIAWDLTDEPPFWLFRDTTDDDARRWTRTLVDALRDADPEHLVTIGTSGQEVGWGPFRADVVAHQLDFGCVHPYPIYQPEIYPDALLSPRMTHAAAFETVLAAGAGKPVMVHEYGASSAQFEPDAIAAYDRLLSYSSLGRGAIGYYAWCWTDAEPDAYRRVPYLRQPHETQFGVTDWRGELRPRGQVLSDLAKTLAALDLDAVARDGPPTARAAIPVPHEYVRPYDPDAYGLSDAPSGLYRPSESAWSPRRVGMTDASPLVRSMLNAFVMGARADLSICFPRERLDDVWPDVEVLMLPAPLASTTITLWHVRTSFWRGAHAFLARGGVLYLSCSADVAIPEMDEIVGCRLVDRAPLDRRPVLRFVRRWGPFRPNDELELPAGDGALASRGVLLRVSDAETVAVDGDGQPALVVARRGAGAAVTCAYPVETLLAATPDAHRPRDPTWGLYAGVAGLLSASDGARCEHPDVTLGELRGPLGGIVSATNHGDAAVSATVQLPVSARSAHRIVVGEPAPTAIVDASMIELELQPFGATVIDWRTDGAFSPSPRRP
jgi:Cellulase (glycosyl hydrolase family 5)